MDVWAASASEAMKQILRSEDGNIDLHSGGGSDDQSCRLRGGFQGHSENQSDFTFRRFGETAANSPPACKMRDGIQD
ncbi:MAG TPA: hypothetical protein DD416_14475 [Rhodobacteraceae bacterium]|nr:hypothetical protein [Paracoccaceae bacterium]